MTAMMTRWELPSFGLDKLALRRVARPTPQAGEILVRVDAVALNFRDGEVATQGMGVPLVFPFTPASDMAGRVVALGDGVDRFSVGDRVISAFIPGWIDGPSKSWADAPTQGGPTPGMLSEFVVTPAQWCVAAPASLTQIESSTLPVAALTAWMALVELGGLRAGQTVLVQGTGGVSLFAIQIAAAYGARVIVTSSRDDKIGSAIALGASHGIHRGEHPEWQAELSRLTNGRGADHILEMAGGPNLERSLAAVAQGGRISVIGLLDADRSSIPTMALLGSRATVVGISVGPRRALEDLVRMIDQYRIKPVIETAYAFSAVPEAFAHLRRGAFGKIVVAVSGA